MIIKQSRIPILQMLTFGLLPNFLKIGYYRLRGAKIGKGVKIGIGAVILSREIEIGDETKIGMLTNITCGKLKIGKRTIIQSFVIINAREISIGNDAIISEIALVRTLIPSTQSKFILHDRVHIFPFALIDPSRKVEIGEESCVGFRSSIFTHSSYKSKLDGYPVEFGEVNIGKGVWLSSDTFVNQSVTIGDEVVVETGTVVSHNIPPGMLVLGSPTRQIKNKDQFLVNYSEQEKFLILIDIINEFCQFLYDFAGFTYQRTDSDTQPKWVLAAQKKRDHYEIELASTCSITTGQSLIVVLNIIPEDIREKWDNEKRNWFSIGSRCCSANLNNLGEEMRQYFKRYGIYFARQ